MQKAFQAKNFGRFILWIWYSELRIEKQKKPAEWQAFRFRAVDHCVRMLVAERPFFVLVLVLVLVLGARCSVLPALNADR
jgi:hypothetical protein